MWRCDRCGGKHLGQAAFYKPLSNNEHVNQKRNGAEPPSPTPLSPSPSNFVQPFRPVPAAIRGLNGEFPLCGCSTTTTVPSFTRL